MFRLNSSRGSGTHRVGGSLCGVTGACLVLGAVVASAGIGATGAESTYDLVLRGGRVVDGAGVAAYFADVAVREGRIAAIGRIPGRGREEIEIQGRVIAPGFVDVHTHAENVMTLRRAENFVRMGVTTLVLGNCGGSVLDVGEFFRKLEAEPASVNVATLIGHNTVRREAMGGAFDRGPSPAEQERMDALVDRAMDDGAVGLSTGLIYLPGSFAQTEEIIRLAKIAATRGGLYATHQRNEGTGITTSLDEVFRIAREAGIRVQVSHIKLSGKSAWGRADAILASLDRARDEGLDITQDQYAYTASSTGLAQLIPASAREGGAAAFRARLEDPARKREIVDRMKETLRARGQDSYDYAVIASYSRDPSLNGKSVVEAARLRRGADTLDDQIELILEVELNGGASAVFHGMSEEDIRTFMRHPNTMIASDSGVRAFDEGVPHPRGYGNNARVLGRYVRETKVLRLEEAVRRMTSLPATVFRLPERGMLQPGFRADIVVFDPSTVRDTATYSEPHQFPVGIDLVLTNGVPVFRGGEHTDARPGQPVRLAAALSRTAAVRASHRIASVDTTPALLRARSHR